MSRNLCRSTCRHCGHDLVLDEAPRPFAKTDCAEYFFDLYDGMIVAHASCPLCGAKYLAWLDGSKRKSGYRHPTPDCFEGVYSIRDLSYRSSFNDETDNPDDLPKFEPVAEMKRLRDENAALKASQKELVEALQDLMASSTALVDAVKKSEPEREAQVQQALAICDRLGGIAERGVALSEKTVDLWKGFGHG